MKYLVTGGLGFIGSHFIRTHLKLHPNDQILNIDKISYSGNPENLRDIESDPRYQFEKGDIADAVFVKKVFENFKPQIVVNFAAECHVDRSILNSKEFIQTNIMGTQVLLDQARVSRIERYLQVSTDEVYGNLGSTGFFTETSSLKPNNPYSASKAGADLLCLSYYHTHHFPVLISRCSNNYGSHQFPEKLIPLMILKASNNQPLPIYGDGQNIRDWIYVEDHCLGLEQILKNGKIGEVYNVGSHTEMTNLNLAKLILDILGKSHSLISFVKDRPGHDRRYAIDATKLNQLGWKPLTSFAEGIKLTVSWYQTHPEWLERLVTDEFRQYIKTQYGTR